MEQGPTCETNRFLFSQEIPLILCNPKFIIKFTRARNLYLFSARSIQSMHPHELLKIHFNIILTSTPVFYNWSLSLRFPHQNPHVAFLSPIRATCSAHVIILYLTNRISGEEQSSESCSLISFLQSPVT